MKSRSPYEVLAVPPGASDKQIEEAYRRLARRHHPDHLPREASEDQVAQANSAMVELNAAYKSLHSRRAALFRHDRDAIVKEPMFPWWAKLIWGFGFFVGLAVLPWLSGPLLYTVVFILILGAGFIVFVGYLSRSASRGPRDR